MLGIALKTTVSVDQIEIDYLQNKYLHCYTISLALLILNIYCTIIQLLGSLIVVASIEYIM